MPKSPSTRTGRTLVVDRDAGVLHVQLNRPADGNAVNRTMSLELVDLLTQIEDDDSISAVILEGAGERFFCTGGDVKEYGRMSRAELAEQFARMRAVCSSLERLPVPVVAAIDGAVVGGGLELSLACDMRIVSPRSWLRLPNIYLGVTTAWGGGRRLAGLVGTSRAREILYSGRRISPDESVAWGLATSMSDSPMAAARELTASMARAPMPALRSVKRVVPGASDGLPADSESEAADEILDLWFSVGTIRQQGGSPLWPGG